MIAFRRTAFFPVTIGILASVAVLAMTARPATAAQGDSPGNPATRPPPSTQPASSRGTATRPGALVLPGEAELREAFDRGEYAEVVKQADRALRFRGKAAADVNRHALCLLKAESHLRLKQYKSAADAFGAAAKSTGDPVEAATARATQRVVTDTKGPSFQRRWFRPGEQPEGADLLDPAQRPDLLRMFRDDLRAQAEPKVKAALRAEELPPITEALDLLWVKLDFEYATNGAIAEDQEQRRQLAERARTLIEGEIDRMEKNVDAIWQSASAVVSKTETATGRSIVAYRGLSNADRGDLKSVISTCERIIPTVKRLAEATGVEPGRDEGLMKRAWKVGNAGRKVLNKDYRAQQVLDSASRNRTSRGGR